MIRLSPTLAVAALLAFGLSTSARAHDAGQQMADAANWFLKSLKPEQKAKATFEFKDEERENWHFIPRERKGLAMREMTPEQKLLGHALLNSGLSNRGLSNRCLSNRSLSKGDVNGSHGGPTERATV